MQERWLHPAERSDFNGNALNGACAPPVGKGADLIEQSAADGKFVHHVSWVRKPGDC
jgi:hypothetical protein